MSYSVPHADRSRRLGIDARGCLRWQDSEGMSYEVLGPTARHGTSFRIDLFSPTASTMPYAVNDYTPCLDAPVHSHNGPGEAEEYAGLSKPTLWLKLQAALGFVLVVGFMLGGLLLSACTPRAITRHRTPAWKRTAFADPEQPAPDSTYFSNL